MDFDTSNEKEKQRRLNPEYMIAYEMQEQNKLLFCINDSLHDIANNL